MCYITFAIVKPIILSYTMRTKTNQTLIVMLLTIAATTGSVQAYAETNEGNKAMSAQTQNTIDADDSVVVDTVSPDALSSEDTMASDTVSPGDTASPADTTSATISLWDIIKKKIGGNMQLVRDCINRMLNDSARKSMNIEEKAIAFFGRTLLPEYEKNHVGITEFQDVAEKAEDSMNQKTYLAKLNKFLERDPLNLQVLTAKFAVLIHLDSIHTPQGQRVKHLFVDILDVIANTGNGTKQKPFLVTCVPEEYLFITYELYGDNVIKQALIRDKVQMDVLYLDKKPKYFESDKVYFDVTLAFETERMEFGPGK